MVAHRRGKFLGVALGPDLEATSARLEAFGFTDQRAANVAAAAARFAQEETDWLLRQLLPKDRWPGHVCLRRHLVQQRDETWLLLRYDKKTSWMLDAVFIA
ncbi:hypothetical protein DES47_101813 [Roseateles toxinivorans]|uniref:Uncharacterized protein n=2 Tax=Roseateles toxinivorans TaxID=270368 RepID=A0A4R6QTM7_9BURK|nr:hypothetical protein DES47_101813 [Roseateles toxinivorans]